MFCPKCGASIGASDQKCSACGEQLATGVNATRPCPPNYLAFAILTTLFCCVPTGIVSIVFAAQVTGKYVAGDYDGALQASNTAKTWSFVSLGLGLAGIILYAAFVGLAIVGHMSPRPY